MAGWGVYSAFTATTTNSGNTITAGTVAIAQHAGSTTLYSALEPGPRRLDRQCVRVTYTGSLASSVKLYASSRHHERLRLQPSGRARLGPLVARQHDELHGLHVLLDARTTARSARFATTYAGGVDGKAAGAAWATNDSVDYRFTITVVDDATPNAHTSALCSGAHTFTWEARNN